MQKPHNHKRSAEIFPKNQHPSPSISFYLCSLFVTYVPRAGINSSRRNDYVEDNFALFHCL